MKNGFRFFVAVLACFGLILSSCASTKILTPVAIEFDIDGIPNLAYCQFFVSKDITLKFLSDNRETGIQESSGTVQAQRTIIRRTIKIARSTPGILQTRNNAGDILDGYDLWVNSSGFIRGVDLSILFDEDDDNAITFYCAYWNDTDTKFYINDEEVNYGGLIYTVTYDEGDEDEPPYLLYKLVERTKEKKETRRAKGRRVGS